MCAALLTFSTLSAPVFPRSTAAAMQIPRRAIGHGLTAGPRTDTAHAPTGGATARQSPVRPSTGVPIDTTAEIPGARYTIFLLTMGNGAQIWELFGHNGIWVHDAETHTDVVYNWGVFDFRAPNFILHFLQDRNMYKVDTLSMAGTMYEYRAWNRSVTAQRLNLSNAQKLQLVQFLQWNERPENQEYRYDYFRDNCSTRARDALDRVLGGRIRALTEHVPSGTTYRREALRLMQGDQPIASGADIGLGRPADRPISVYQAMFLPRKLHDFVATMQIPDSAGRPQPLVAAEQVMFQAVRPPEFTAPPDLVLPFLIAGLVIAGLIIWLGVVTRSQPAPAATALLSMVLCLWSVVAGILGLLLTLLWTVTDHTFAYQNENLLLFNVVWLALAVMLPVWLVRGAWEKPTRILVLIVGALAGVAVLLHAIGLSRQVNFAEIALALPPAASLVWLVATRPPRLGKLGAELSSRGA